MSLQIIRHWGVEMGRSNGYRPTVAVRKEVLALRAQLAELTDEQWVKASYIMRNITTILGHSGGPMNGNIQPRVCRYCKHYGHTKQWCKVRLDREQKAMDKELQQVAREAAECEQLPESSEFAELDARYVACVALWGTRGGCETPEDRVCGMWGKERCGTCAAWHELFWSDRCAP